MNALMPRATIEDIVRYRDQAIALYEVAYTKIEEASEAIKAAHAMASNCHPGTNSYNYAEGKEIEAFRKAVRLPERTQYLRTARRLTDLDAWSYIVERTDLQRLMDSEAKDQLQNQMRYIPDRVDRSGQLINEEEIAKGMPPLTVDNIMATLEQFALDADTIFRRGIANAFSKLDRRFRSHDGFKIGSRLILTRVFNEWGSLNYGRIRDTLIDIERVFSVLDGHDEAAFTSALYAIEMDRRNCHGKRQSEVETEYFKIRGFMNGNAHLWFQRADLVVKVNKLLAEYYGEVIADGQQADEDPFANIKNVPAKRFGFYPTPDGACDRVFRNISVLQRADHPQLRILEPSAGTGNLARRCVRSIDDLGNYERERYLDQFRFDNLVDCVEIQPGLAQALQEEGIYNRVFTKDFLQLTPDVTGLYDLVVMNPPFDRERDIDHVMHALKFLKEDGRLVAIMSAGTEFRETKKSTAFRALMQKMNAQWEDLPPGSFSEVGTNVNTFFLKVWKNGTRYGR
ncbi:DUF4942 domain-containing protein [Phyllobacterium sp. P30BS-XVII]|uniref:DUF4942 domain-containing protein n=1 Tax=Phyllobacterium sp. P30BS-XVII TaxID=2587046 RepID=UPI0015F7B54C|nr:DUF4942 domain-containing protein [Phyllobacterium sp. P30BS-XVII]MBA8904116.1 hypothetical protein [Phyllobacterium sp. P30BS-XVII]